MRAWLIFGVLLGAALSYWLEVWHAVVLLLGLVAWQRKKNRYLPDKILATPQEIENAKMVPLKPGVLAGIRVLEIANTVAGPMTTRILAEMGAEVIKVEPKEGDMWRKFLSIVMPSHLRDSVCFSPANVNKNSIIIDYSKAEGIALIKKLLADCDVLVTNVRLDSLRKAGLFYDQVHLEFPRLVYASLTAWGSHGPDYMLPGYDIGAFYAASGMSGRSCVYEGNYSCFTTSFGDVTTATGLAAAVVAALSHRLRTNKGQLVSTSLLKQGCWMMSSDLSKAKLKDNIMEAPDYSEFAKPHPLNDAYTTKDGSMIQLVGAAWPGKESSSFEELRLLVATLEKSQVPVPFVHIPGRNAALAAEVGRHANVWAPSPEGTQEIHKMIRLPFDLSLFAEQHGPHTRAPILGEHTLVIQRNGWSPRRVQDDFVYGSEAGVKSFTGLAVWEIADTENIVPQVAGTHLLHYGASVFHLRRGIVDELPQLVEGKNMLQDNPTDFSKCNVLLTNLPEINVKELHEKFPHLIIAQLTSFGSVEDQVTRRSVGPFTSASGMCFLHGAGDVSPHRVPSFPKYVGDFITANHLVAGINLALYHFQRTGKGQIVSANFLRSGMFGLTCVTAPVKMLFGSKLKSRPAHELRDAYMAPTANTFKTKDGWHVNLMGADLKRHLKRTVKAFGLTKADYFALASAGVASLFKHREMTDRIEHVFIVLNRILQSKFGEKTFKEWKMIFAEHDVWYTPVNMVDDARSYYQAIEIGIFAKENQVAFPITMYGYESK